MHQLRAAALVFSLLVTGTLQAEPKAVVESFHHALLQAMQTESYDARVAIVDAAVDSHFQLETIARISLGRNWRPLADDDKHRYLKLLRELVTTTYASRFASFDGQTFTTQNSKAISKSRTRVKTILTTKSEVVSLDYQLQHHDNSWRIYDIVANGVSDLSLKRSNFAALFADGGLDAVASDIRSSIKKNREDISG